MQQKAGGLRGTGPWRTHPALDHSVFSWPLAVESHQGASLLRPASQSQDRRAEMKVTGLELLGSGSLCGGGVLCQGPHIGPQKRIASAGCLGLSQRALGGGVEGGGSDLSCW